MSVVGAVMDYIFDWEADGDRFSFEDSDRFEEDSLCSWISEPESLCNNWRGWRKQNGGGGGGGSGVTATPGAGGTLGGPPGLGNACTGSSLTNDGEVSSLMDLAAQAVARHLPFEVVEHFYQPIPEQLQLRIAFWSFPENEEDIRLYSCLANGSSDEFQRGEMMFKNKSVNDALQIGFHLSATVTPPMSSTQVKGSYNVALVFDRRHITSCTCSCSPHGSTASWCAHVVALCLFRIHQSSQVCLRAPVSESLSRLERDQLQKFAQYLISELPQQILPTAQRLLDELLSSQKTMINTVCGAPDPTAGPSAGEQTTWCLDEVTLHENIKKTLVKFCVPSPVVLSDVNYLSNNAPPAANEWQSLLRPLRGREPEGIWNLLLIVREMFRRSDNNAIPLLEILTEEILACEQIVVWWFNNKTQTQNSLHSSRSINQNNTHSSQHAASSLCDEIVMLWRLAALNPALASVQRSGLCSQLKDWHISTIEKLRKSRSSNGMSHQIQVPPPALRKSDIDAFTGFKSAIEACQLEWNDYLLIGFMRNSSTSWIGSLSRMRSEGESNRMAHAKGYGKSPVSCTVNVTDGLNLIRGPIRAMMAAAAEGGGAGGGQRKGLYSSGSEGFSEGERRPMIDSGEDHISTETMVASSEEGGTPKVASLSHGANTGKPMGKAEDADSDCGSLPSTPGFQAASTGPGVFNGSKESPNGTQTTSSSTQGVMSGGETVNQPSWENQKRDSTSSTPPDPGLGGGVVAVVPPQLPEATSSAKTSPTSVKTSSSSTDKSKSREHDYFVGVRKPENKQEIMFALAEALHAHGHVREAGRLARELAEEMIASGPDAGIDYSATKEKKKRVQSYNSATLSNASFLCSVLLEDLDCRHLAFRIGLFGLEMARTPATSKSLEVKLAHQESELVIQLKKIPLGAEEMAIIRDRAEKLRDGKLKSRGEALLPITLASFIFDSLCLPVNKATVGGVQATRSGACLTPADEKLGFEAAVAALGLKANVSEAEHPLLCEGTRRQKGELAVAMLVHYKDDPQKLARIMDKLLDKEVHQLYRNAPATSGSASSNGSSASDTGLGLLGNTVAHSGSNCQLQSSDAVAPSGGGGGGAKDEVTTLTKTEQPSLNRTEAAAASATVPMKPKPLPSTSKDTDSSAMEEDLEGSGDYKAWEAKFRCANLRTTKKHSVGMASVDSSAPETTSSDNSPTLIRRNAATGHHGLVHHGPGSDSGSSHKSSDSVGSSGCDFQGVLKARDNDSPPSTTDGVAVPPVNLIYSRSSTPNVKGARYKGKNRVMPVVPNQPSEASAHFMFELAKTVLVKAGGTSSTSLFVNQSATNNTNPTGPHRALHLCAFQIGLYALGLNNFVSPNWLSRTYSSHVSWITGQATEIGYPAINILIKTWEGHLTPQEVASLADRASRCRDPNMVRAAAELALSCLPHAQALNPNEIQRALIQCKEQSKDMLQRACLSVEMAAKEGGVYPEVLFEVAKRWYELYEEALHGPLQPGASASGGVDRNAGPSRAQRTSDVATSGGAGTIPIVHVVRDQSGPGMLNPGPLVASAALCAPGQIGTYPSGGPLPIPPMSYALPAGQQFQVLHPFLAPQYAYVQSIAPPNFGHYYGIPSPHIPHSQPMHMTKYPYSGGQQPYVQSNLTPAFHPGVRPPPPFHPVAFVSATTSAGGSQQPGGGPGPAINNWGLPPTSYGLLQPVDGTQALPQQPTAPSGGQQGGAMVPGPAPVPMDVALSSPVQINYLLAAYRVGMLAMETLARRVHDDRPQIKYARNPPYGEDVKWLHGIAMKLGTSYLQQFCASTVNTIVSPFILLDIAMESANFLAGNNVTQVPQQLRLPMLSSLLQRCLQMFIQCTHTRIHHITQVDYDEFVSIVCSARNAFCMTPDGLTQFNEMLQGLRRSKSCKRELWQRIISALHNSSSI